MSLPAMLESSAEFPRVVIGYVSVRSRGDTSIFDVDDVGDADAFHASEDDHREAARAIEAAGLEVLATSRLGVAVAGPSQAFAELTGGEIVTRERLMRTRAGREEYVTHLDIVGSGQPDALGVAV